MVSITKICRPVWRNKTAFCVFLLFISMFSYFVNWYNIPVLYIRSDSSSNGVEFIYINQTQGYKSVHSEDKINSKEVNTTRNSGKTLNSAPLNVNPTETSTFYRKMPTIYFEKLTTHGNPTSTRRLLDNQGEGKIFSRLKSTQVDCVKIIQGDKKTIEEGRNLNSSSNVKNLYRNISGKCNEFIKQRNYIMSSLTVEEELFPIAYSLLVFKDFEQVERLLRAVYRPQNYYCIHIDQKSSSEFKENIWNLSSCFDNVFITKRSVNVVWGHFSVLEPEIICMEELLKIKKWKYFINLTGQEYPLRTNSELVKILKIYNGANDLEGTIKRANKDRWDVKKRPPPHGITPVKGSVHIVVNRKFVEYAIYNQTAKDFLEWTRHILVPDEAFFSSLNHNPHLKIPGSYTGEPETNWNTKPFLARFKNWYGTTPCHGELVRGICIFGVGDLPELTKRPQLFTNKFHLDFQPIALDCMEEFHYNRTRDEYYNKFIFNTTFYENLEFIKHVIK